MSEQVTPEQLLDEMSSTRQVLQEVRTLLQTEAEQRTPGAGSSAAITAPDGAPVAADHVPGLCDSAECSLCSEAVQGIRDRTAHTLEHALTWAGYENLLPDIDGAVQRWVEAGKPTDGREG